MPVNANQPQWPNGPYNMREIQDGYKWSVVWDAHTPKVAYLYISVATWNRHTYRMASLIHPKGAANTPNWAVVKIPVTQSRGKVTFQTKLKDEIEKVVHSFGVVVKPIDLYPALVLEFAGKLESLSKPFTVQVDDAKRNNILQFSATPDPRNKSIDYNLNYPNRYGKQPRPVTAAGSASTEEVMGMGLHFDYWRAIYPHEGFGRENHRCSFVDVYTWGKHKTESVEFVKKSLQPTPRPVFFPLEGQQNWQLEIDRNIEKFIIDPPGFGAGEGNPP